MKFKSILAAVCMAGAIISFSACEKPDNGGKGDDNSTGNTPGGNTPGVVNYNSLNGIWTNKTKKVETTVNGTVGRYTKALFDSEAGGHGVYEFIQAGFFKIGDEAFRNLVSTGEKTWEGEFLVRQYKENYTTGEITLVKVVWEDCKITLSSDGKTFYAESQETFTSGTYYRK